MICTLLLFALFFIIFKTFCSSKFGRYNLLPTHGAPLHKSTPAVKLVGTFDPPLSLESRSPSPRHLSRRHKDVYIKAIPITLAMLGRSPCPLWLIKCCLVCRRQVHELKNYCEAFWAERFVCMYMMSTIIKYSRIQTSHNPASKSTAAPSLSEAHRVHNGVLHCHGEFDFRAHCH
jgi:hypothetical protein